MAMNFGPVFKPGEKWVGGLLKEYGEPTAKTTTTWSTSYTVDSVAGRGTQLLVVLGTAREGDVSILERWDLPPLTGAPTVTIAQAVIAVGVPVATPPVSVGFHGGMWIAPAQRATQPQPVRTECYRGPKLGEDLELEVDPDGRFALILARDHGTLYQIMLREGAEPVVVYDDTSVSSLGFVHGIQTFRHATLGRQVSGLIRAPGLATIIFYDYDNDGIFDSVDEVSLSVLNNMNLPEDWVEDYTNYSGVFAPTNW